MVQVIDLSVNTDRNKPFNQFLSGIQAMDAANRRDTAKVEADKERERGLRMKALDMATSAGVDVSQPETAERIAQIGVENPTALPGLLQRSEKTQDFTESRDIARETKRAGLKKLQQDTEELDKPFAETRKGRQFAEQQRIKAGIAAPKEKKTVRRNLTNKRDKITKEFKDIDRVFGNVDAFAGKFNRGEPLTASDQFQLIRSIVPLAEINPGVVRGEEFETARSLGGKLGAAQVYLNNLAKGELLPANVIKDLLATTDEMRGVVTRGKESRYSDLTDEAKFEGLGDNELNVVLGDMGRNTMRAKAERIAREEQAAIQEQALASSAQQFQQGLTQQLQQGQPQQPGLIPQAQAARVPFDLGQFSREDKLNFLRGQ